MAATECRCNKAERDGFIRSLIQSGKYEREEETREGTLRVFFREEISPEFPNMLVWRQFEPSIDDKNSKWGYIVTDGMAD